MLEKNHVDLSIPYNQKRIISTFIEYFTVEELEQIDLSKIKCPADGTAVISCHGMDMVQKFTTSSFTIKCVLDVETIPPQHHVRLEFLKNGLFNTNIECNPDYRNAYYIAFMITQAINFSKYRAQNDYFYNRRSIINNVSTRVAQVIPSHIHIYVFRDMIMRNLYLNQKYKEQGVDFICTKDEYKLEVVQYYTDILKVIFFNKNTSDYVFLNQNDLGMNMILLVADKAIVELKGEVYYDFGEENIGID